jgi:hypothetical protein
MKCIHGTPLAFECFQCTVSKPRGSCQPAPSIGELMQLVQYMDDRLIQAERTIEMLQMQLSYVGRNP